MTKDAKTPEVIPDDALDAAQGGAITAQKDLNISAGDNEDETKHSIQLENATIASIRTTT